MVALGLRRHVFSPESTEADRRRTLAHLKSGNGDDAGWNRCAATTGVGRRDAPRVEPSRGGLNNRRWRSLDLELGGGPLCGGAATTGSMARAPASVDRRPRAPPRR